MRKLEPVKDDALTFIGEVISSSRKKGKDSDESNNITEIFRKTCSTLVSDNEQVIKQYDYDFKMNSLENLKDIGRLNDEEKDDFLSLYSYQKKRIKNLRNEVLTQNGYINENCPICECDSVSTMDHYLPKEKYPIFVVHPRNLIPCCGACNGHKSDIVFQEGKRKFWNCYLDQPITKRYLYCTITKTNDLLVGKFSTDYSLLFDHEAVMIENTMSDKGQNVLEQYNKKVGNGINELVKNIVRLRQSSYSYDDSLEILKKQLPKTILNDWKDVLYDALLNSQEFVRFAEIESEKILEK